MEKKIVVQKNKVIEFSDERSKKLVENAIKKNEKFFGNLVCDFSVTFLKTRKEYDKLVNYFYDRILERNKNHQKYVKEMTLKSECRMIISVYQIPYLQENIPLELKSYLSCIF